MTPPPQFSSVSKKEKQDFADLLFQLKNKIIEFLVVLEVIKLCCVMEQSYSPHSFWLAFMENTYQPPEFG